MKVLLAFLGIVFFVHIFARTPVFAQNTFLAPVPEESAPGPAISILSPLKDSVVTSRINLVFAVTAFELTARPIESSSAGVISIYVDGKFFTNTASSSASISIPKTGTHLIEAELTRVDRTPFIPRASDSMYIHVQKKTPFLMIPSFRPDTKIYSATPTFKVTHLPASFEDKSGYYQVFIDGEVDGNSKDLPDPSSYIVNTPLIEGKHSLRLALYTENARPYLPTVEYQIPFTYSAIKPIIDEVKISRTIAVEQEVPFELILSHFEPGKDGYIDVLAEGVHYYLSSSKAVFPRLSAGNQKISYTLLDKNGYALIPPVSTEMVVSVIANSVNSNSVNSLLAPGIFSMNENGSQPRWGFLILGVIEALAIIVFGILLLKHERHK
ncbi:MAG: hypothetical protein M3Q44_02875 [bacterium]|nr:hypothetical protein [bacterium]